MNTPPSPPVTPPVTPRNRPKLVNSYNAPCKNPLRFQNTDSPLFNCNLLPFGVDLQPPFNFDLQLPSDLNLPLPSDLNLPPPFDSRLQLPFDCRRQLPFDLFIDDIPMEEPLKRCVAICCCGSSICPKVCDPPSPGRPKPIPALCGVKRKFDT